MTLYLTKLSISKNCVQNGYISFSLCVTDAIYIFHLLAASNRFKLRPVGI